MSSSSNSIDAAVLQAAHVFLRRSAIRYPVRSAMLFGSRARGAGRPDSDVDIAVLLRGMRRSFMETKLALTDIAYDVLLETGVYIQALPIWEDEWDHPETHRNPRLLRNIEREGVPL
jgi:predicted nucleotidyltransferase